MKMNEDLTATTAAEAAEGCNEPQASGTDAESTTRQPDAAEASALLAELGELRGELASLRRALDAGSAKNANDHAAACSSGPVRGSSEEFFSQDEVRAMSPAEVRSNYAKIERSMANWH